MASTRIRVLHETAIEEVREVGDGVDVRLRSIRSGGEETRRAAFVAGYLPNDHKTCQQSSWLDWFRLNGDGAPPADAPSQEDTP